MGEQCQISILFVFFWDREKPITKVNFFQHGLIKVIGLLLVSVAPKFYLLLSTLLAALPHSVVTDAHSDDPHSSRNVEIMFITF